MTPSGGARGAGASARPSRALVTAWNRSFRLAAGRTGAYDKGLELYQDGAVGQVHAASGKLLAAVSARGDAGGRAHIAVPPLEEDEWRELADRLAGLPDAMAELLAGKVPAVIAEPGRVGGLSVVPGPHELGFFCTCLPARSPSRPCAHSSALGHALAVRLSASPSVLMVARGMTVARLAGLVRARVPRQGPAALVADATGRVRADRAYALRDGRPAGGYAHAEPDVVAPVVDTLADPPAPAPAREDLAWLVRDAARRAQDLLDGVADGPCTRLADAVRLLASPAGFARLPEAAGRVGRGEAELRRLLVAHRHGGPGGVHVAALPLAVGPGAVEAAAAAVRARRNRPVGALGTDGNRITDRSSGVQLRLGPDGRWYPFTGAGDDWYPAPGHSADPVRAYDAARRARLARPARA